MIRRAQRADTQKTVAAAGPRLKPGGSVVPRFIVKGERRRRNRTRKVDPNAKDVSKNLEGKPRASTGSEAIFRGIE